MENPAEEIPNNSKKFEIGEPVMIRNHTCHTFEPKFLLDYKVLKTHLCSLHQMAKK